MSAQQGIIPEDELQQLLLQSDQVSQQKVLAYMDHIKNTSNGWQVHIDLLMNGSMHNNNFKFFCLQVIESYVKHSYGNASTKEQTKMKQFLSSWINLQCIPLAHSEVLPTYIRNKIAQIFALVFLHDFPNRWPSYFSDLIHTLNMGLSAVDNYIRVLSAIDSQITDQSPGCTATEMQRNLIIKSTIKETALDKLVAESWYEILNIYQGSNTDILCQCLDVISLYMSWINIHHVANERFVQLLLQLIKLVRVRDSVVDCFYNMIIKGMEPLDKYKLIESLFRLLIHNIMEPNQYDIQYICKISRLVNGIGINLITAFKELSRRGTPTQLEELLFAIEQKIPLLIQFLGNDCYNVSMEVILFALEYLHLLKTLPTLSKEQVDKIRRILTTILQKMTNSQCILNDPKEDNATFLDYRMQLKGLFINLVKLDNDAVYRFTETNITEVLLNWRTTRFEDVNVAMTLLYFIGEAVTPTVICREFVSSTTEFFKKPPMQRMICKLVTSEVSSHPHSAVKLQYFKTVVRYNKFFAVESQYLPELIKMFLGEKGLRSSDSKLSNCVAVLFLVLVKSLNQYMSGYALDILVELSDILLLQNNIEKGKKQLNLYEAAAVLIVSSSQTSQEKGVLFHRLIYPNLLKFRSTVVQLRDSLDEKTNECMANDLCHIMAVTCHASKAFANNNTIKSCASMQVFEEALQTFLSCLELPLQTIALLQVGTMKFLYRMVVCLEEGILPYIPQAAQGLLKYGDIASIQEYLALITQILTKIKLFHECKTEHLSLIQKILMPIMNMSITALATPIEENDYARIEMQKLHQNYCRLVKAIVSCKVVTVLRAHECSFLERLILCTMQGAIISSDPIAQMTSFSAFRRLVDLCSEKGEPCGYTQFIYKYIIPACFQAPMNPTFDLHDGGARHVFTESIKCIQEMYRKRGDEFINYLKHEYLPTLSLTPSGIGDYCEALLANNKVFTSHVEKLFEEARNRR